MPLKPVTSNFKYDCIISLELVRARSELEVPLVEVGLEELTYESCLGAKVARLARSIVKFVALMPLPRPLVTVIFPALGVAPLGTLARIFVSESTVNVVAVKPLKLTAVVPVKKLPLIVTSVVIGPFAGENEAIAGGASTVKFVALLPVPIALVMLILPVVAPTGTVARTSVSASITNVAGVPLNATAVNELNRTPLIVTSVPTGALAGVNEEITNGGNTVKFAGLEPVPSGLVMLIFPVVALAGTVARICVSESSVNAAGTPLKATTVAVLNTAPVIVTSVVAVPLTGANAVITGGAGKVSITNSGRVAPSLE